MRRPSPRPGRRRRATERPLGALVFEPAGAACDRPRRLRRLELRALDREGKPFRLEASGFFARVIQHECDHLDGSVYLDRMKDARSLSFIDEWDRHCEARRSAEGSKGRPTK